MPWAKGSSESWSSPESTVPAAGAGSSVEASVRPSASRDARRGSAAGTGPEWLAREPSMPWAKSSSESSSSPESTVPAPGARSSVEAFVPPSASRDARRGSSAGTGPAWLASEPSMPWAKGSSESSGSLESSTAAAGSGGSRMNHRRRAPIEASMLRLPSNGPLSSGSDTQLPCGGAGRLIDSTRPRPGGFSDCRLCSSAPRKPGRKSDTAPKAPRFSSAAGYRRLASAPPPPWRRGCRF